jgi:hypothetical protein
MYLILVKIIGNFDFTLRTLTVFPPSQMLYHCSMIHLHIVIYSLRPKKRVILGFKFCPIKSVAGHPTHRYRTTFSSCPCSLFTQATPRLIPWLLPSKRLNLGTKGVYSR